MKNPTPSFTAPALSRRFGKPKRWLLATAIAGTATFAWIAAAQLQPTTYKAVELSTTPLYSKSAAAAKPTLTLALSVEYPTVGAMYRDAYAETTPYLGYFDEQGCYSYSTQDKRFQRVSDATPDTHRCTDQFSGNFMNWASSSAIDILRRALNGGDRAVDTASATVLQRAYLYQNWFYSPFFPKKTISSTLAVGALPEANRNTTGDTVIGNCNESIAFGDAAGAAGTCPTTATPGKGGNKGVYPVHVEVCSSTGEISNDKRAGLCMKYPNGNFKPIGAMQKNSENLRLAAFGYLMEDGTARYGGVLRAPMKWVGPKAFDKDGVPIAGINPRSEWNPQDGIFTVNPEGTEQNADGISGVVNYLNKFGRLGPTPGVYKASDPVGELYYESLRYLQGLPPTDKAVSELDGKTASRAGFPVYTDWTKLDPHEGGNPTANYSCIRNNIFTIGDVNTHADSSIPGNTKTGYNDFSRTAQENLNEPDFVYWTNVVSGFETATSVDYKFQSNQPTAVAGEVQPIVNATTSNPNTDLPGKTLTGLGARMTGSGSSASYYMAGMAYWANTHDIRGTGWTQAPDKQRPGMRVRTYMLDVNENSTDSVLSNRQKTQFFLAAKYGGFKDQSGKGNPFLDENGILSNASWTNTDGNGDPKNYYLANSAEAIISGIDEIFYAAAAEGNNIAGGALSSPYFDPTAKDARIYNTRFNAEDWSGDVIARPIEISADGKEASIGSADSAAGWSAAKQFAAMDEAARKSRNIIVGGRTEAGGVETTPFTEWSKLPKAFQKEMQVGLLGGVFGLAENTLDGLLGGLGLGQLTDSLTSALKNFLGGLLGAGGTTGGTTSADTAAAKEIADMQIHFLRGEKNYNNVPIAGQTKTVAGKSFTFRNQTNLLGDIVNSAVAFSGKPTNGISDTSYATFYNDAAVKNRKSAIFVGANDGMLHAFDATNGKELFAYIPSWMALSLPSLTDARYGQTLATPHRAYVDASPTVAEAQVGDTWKTVLVSGTGAGGQGVFALDVTRRVGTTFSSDNVLWEFTDKDDPSIGNVIGKPQIQKFKTKNATAGAPAEYKWYAVIASGVNNHVADGYASTAADQALFLLDLGKDRLTAWQAGVNYFKLTIPADSALSATVAPGVVNFAAAGGRAGEVATIYAGDLHGQMWKLDFALQMANDSKGEKTLASSVLELNKASKLLFSSPRAVSGTTTVPQAISMAPTLIAGPRLGGLDTVVVMFGTGKYLEDNDNALTANMPAQSVYAILDDGAGTTVARTDLQKGSFSAAGQLSMDPFIWGLPKKDTLQKPGWYFDFAAGATPNGERQISNFVLFGKSVSFNSTLPPGGATDPCSATGSKTYEVNFADGSGSVRTSTVGLMSAPMLMLLPASGAYGDRNSAGTRQYTNKARTLAIGQNGIDISGEKTDVSDAGPLTWRLIENYKALKADAAKN